MVKRDTVKFNGGYQRISVYAILFLGIGGYTVFFTALQVIKYRTLFTLNPISLAGFNQVAINTARGIPFYCSFSNDVFANNHFHLIFILLALAYKIYPHIYTLFFCVSFALGIGGVGIYLITKKLFSSIRMGVFFFIVYLLSPVLHFINFVDFRPIVLSIPFFIFMVYFYMEEKFIPFFVFSSLFLMCQEHLAFCLMMFGISSIFRRKSLQWILMPIIYGGAWFIVTATIILPSLGYEIYRPLEDYFRGERNSLAHGCLWILENPLAALKIMFSSSHISYLAMIVNPAIFSMAIFSPEILVFAFPTFLELLLRTDAYQFTPDLATTSISPIFVCLFLALVHSYKKIFTAVNSLKLPSAIQIGFKKIILLALVSWTCTGNLGNNLIFDKNSREKGVDIAEKFKRATNMFDPVFYTIEEDDYLAWRLISAIPVEASVATRGDLLPALSNRARLYEFGRVGFQKKEKEVGVGSYLLPDYIIFRRKTCFYGAYNDEIDDAMALDFAHRLINEHTYNSVVENDTFVFLKRNP
ncbi:MAG: hypothetical protein A2Y00_07075 [Omnitrophica WOR_2 bacterium GWF2_43_52]|nr:MAG: hypothetical protein A2Y00_07075 [Omnitrophica WOR_2 bacterium GWF2_43_52]OGX55464.1 MAG: hypothetical protein A2460_08870 [Omnitrophica WOR_2 bacterium RIFOXYC2_FULL_43_9]HAH19309.1 hypothetical protein [Candidatus Omnitrophota bacterium]HBG63668.1 hypothetical protein [Candidatus Omnitrophota bacterium]